MAKQLVSVRLPSEAVEALDRLAGPQGLTRTRLLEVLVERFLEEDFFLQKRVLGRSLLRTRGVEDGV